MTISLTEQGKKHQPLVRVEDENIIISIGREIEHPMLEVHLIETVDLLMYTKAGLLRVKTLSRSIPGIEGILDFPPIAKTSLSLLKLSPKAYHNFRHS